MSDIILHHFDSSPFAEKVRLTLGLKDLAWQSVEIPMVMPKPMLTALTGGYRKTPVMQIGSDIYCDTQLIAMELERRHPQPSLFPGRSEGLALALSQWSDTAFFQPGAGLAIGTNRELPGEVLNDRRAFFNFLDFNTLDEQIPHLLGQFRGHLQLVEKMLDDGRDYLLGEQPGWVDILAYFPLWMARGNIAAVDELVQGLAAVPLWEKRVQAFGHGHPTAISAERALDIARETESTAREEVVSGSWPALSVGARVSVTPQDYGAVPVSGSLLRHTHVDIAIRREDPQAGAVVVHFPRLGYRVETCE